MLTVLRLPCAARSGAPQANLIIKQMKSVCSPKRIQQKKATFECNLPFVLWTFIANDLFFKNFFSFLMI